MAGWLDKVGEEAKANDALFDKLKTLIKNPKGVALLDTALAKRSTYGEARGRLVKMIQDGKTEEAASYLLGDFQTPQRDFFDAVAAIVKFQEDLMAEDSATMDKDGDFASYVVQILTVLAALSAVAIAVTTARSITGPVAVAVDLVTKVADGDLTSTVEVKTQDEIGHLLQSMATMQANLVRIVGTVMQGSEGVATASAQIARATTTCRHAPSNRPVRWKKPRPAWKS